MPADPRADEIPPSSAGSREAPVIEAPLSPALPQSAASETEPAAPPPPVPIPPPIDVHDLDWNTIAASVSPGAVRARMRATVEQLETILDSESGLRLLFDVYREDPADRVLRITEVSDDPLWFIGDLHGDLLTLEAALRLINHHSAGANRGPARIVLLGDLFDDGGFGLETLLRVFELMLHTPSQVCLLAGNHDEALGYDGSRFTATVSPSDFCDSLNANLAHEWMGRAGKLAVRLVAQAPRALFFPDGLLAVHGGFPLRDLHAHLAESRDWNDPACLMDFVWTRLHPRARKKMPNRSSRGSQFGYEDFAAFCALSASLDRPVTHMVRGHDHVEQRYETYPAYARTPVLTTVGLSRRLGRELFGPFVRVPTVARWVRGSLPEVYRLHIPEEHVRRWYPEEVNEAEAAPIHEERPT